MMRPMILFFGFLLLFSGGCVQYHYTANQVHTPYFDKKGDAMVSASIGGSPVTLRGDFHASFSPIKHGTVMLNYFQTLTNFNDADFFTGTNYLKRTRGYLFEGAAGGYMPFAFGTGALYVGYGQGRMRNDFGLERIADLRLQRLFVQPTFTFKSEWFRLGMALRVVRLNFPSGDIDYRIEPEDLQVIQRLENNGPFWFPEMGGNIGIHIKPITITANLILVGTKKAAEYGIDPMNIGLGLTYEL